MDKERGIRIAKLLEETDLQKALMKTVAKICNQYNVPESLLSKFERLSIQRHHEIMG